MSETPRRHAPRGPIKTRDPLSGEHPLSQKCSAHSKRTGKQCGQWAIPGGRVCKWHGGAAPQVIAKAEERLEMHYPKAVRVAGELLDRPEFPTVQAQMVKFIVEHKDGRATERLDANVNLQVNIVDVLRQRHERAKSLGKMAPSHGPETHVSAG